MELRARVTRLDFSACPCHRDHIQPVGWRWRWRGNLSNLNKDTYTVSDWPTRTAGDDDWMNPPRAQLKFGQFIFLGALKLGAGEAGVSPVVKSTHSLLNNQGQEKQMTTESYRTRWSVLITPCMRADVKLGFELRTGGGSNVETPPSTFF